MIKRAHHNAQEWNDILKATGGTLNLLKFFFQITSITFSQSGAPIIAAHDESWYIDIKDKTDKTTERVKAISAYTQYKTLGTIQGIYKKQDDRFKVQLTKSTRLTCALVCNHVSVNALLFVGTQYLCPVLLSHLESIISQTFNCTISKRSISR